MDDLTALEEWAGALLDQMKPAARRKVAMDVGRALRRNQQKRIAQQKNPDGTAYDPRKSKPRAKKGRIKRRAMFAKLRTARLLKVQTDDGGISVGFTGRAARLARVHQEGETSEVVPGTTYRYPIRQLLGFTDEDREMIRAKLLEHLSG